MSEHPREFVVQRSKWLRGRKEGAVLLDESGRMCCLGFVSEQCGVPTAALLGTGVPNRLPDTSGRPLLGLLLRYWTKHTSLAVRAVEWNDALGITDTERESQLSALFAQHGYTLRFEP
jgi:hypothetical protein